MAIICVQNFKAARYSSYLIIFNNRTRVRILFPPFQERIFYYLKREKSSVTFRLGERKLKHIITRIKVIKLGLVSGDVE